MGFHLGDIATPAGRVPGGNGLIPAAIKDAKARPLAPQGLTEMRPYLRAKTRR